MWIFLISVHPKCWGRLPSKVLKRELFVRIYLEFRRFAKEKDQKEMTTVVWSSEVMGWNAFFGWSQAEGTSCWYHPPWQPPVALVTWAPRWSCARIGSADRAGWSQHKGWRKSDLHIGWTLWLQGVGVRLMVDVGHKKLPEIMEWVRYRMRLLIFI